ncbi:MAG: ZrgA family zinc uptake protein [Acidimicrobiales bacterium]
MTTSHRIVALVFSVLGLGGLSACSAEADSTTAGAASEDTQSDQNDGEDHDDEDHDDEDGEDHDGEDHDGEDHDGEDHDDGATSGLDAHEHGVAELTVAWSEGDMIIDLISPAFNIFGFEREPVTDDELAIAADRTAALSAPGILVINPEAGCSLVDEVVTEFEVEGSHAELSASWMFVCDSPDEIRQLDAAALFGEFPNLEDIDAQWASASGQSAAELSPSETIFALE